MKKEFIYTVRFGEEYLFDTSDIEVAIKMAIYLKKNLENQGKTGFYDIYFADILIAQF